ncbi:MAG TPA: cupin domain-containing protein [Acidiphilium sp.]
MLALKSGAIPALAPWGSITDLGSESLDGDVKAFGAITHGTPDAPLSAGYFGCTQGAFRMVYPFTEHAVVLEGEVTLLNEATGDAVTYKPGDAWMIEKGTPVRWTIHTPHFVKHYMAAA